ncbi:MAG: alanine racemase [Rhodocyclaceae bacterium]|nr:alanine racemase [Rhodocyclaceae bacterium]
MRPAKALIDLGALRHNYALARRLHGGKALAVVKANAYGHGAVVCAHALADLADGFAVACLEEAEGLRAGGITAPILLLEGVFEVSEWARADALGLWVVVHQAEQLEMLAACRPKRPIPVWMKFNSGMNRAGLPLARLPALHAQLAGDPKVASVTLMSHFARADEPECDETRRQFERLRAAMEGVPAPVSICNSAGILGWPGIRGDWARPGIMLYGADPMPGEGHGLRPVMQLGSRIMAVRQLSAGDPVGYGARFVAPRPMRIGLVAMGYADGYPRAVPDGAPVVVAGQRTRIVGRVSMDMLTVDLEGIDADVGSPVELWGGAVSVNEVAAVAGTIAYELLCNVKRVAFEYVQPA